MKKTSTLILNLLMASGIFSTISIAKGKKKNKPKKIIASYIPLYEKWKAEDIQGYKLTDAIIAFAKFDENNRISFDKYNQTELEEVKRLTNLYPHLNISLSIGGWGVTEFSEVAASEELRALFISDCIELLETYNMNGIDIDWEYPVGENWLPDVDRSWNDKVNFTKLIREFRAELDKLEKINGKEYILSYASGINEWAITNLEYKEVFQLVDRINLMGYSYEGSWSTRTGHASALYPYSSSSYYSLNSSDAVELFIKYGAKKDKLILGVPFFSQDWYGVNNVNNGLGQKFKGSNNLNMGYTKLKNEFINKNGFIRHWDDEAKVPYLFNGDMFISYDDEESICYKANYVLKKNLGGIMSWQYLQDRSGDLLKVINEILNSSYNEWKAETSYKKDDIVLHNCIEYRCLADHKSLINWAPNKANTLWTIVSKNKH